MWKQALNRLSLILALASLGLLLCSAAVEASAYLMPFEGWLGSFSFYAVLFFFIYARTRPSIPTPNLDTPPDSSNDELG